MRLTLLKPPTSSLTGATTNASAVVIGFSSTATLYVGQPVTGTGVPDGATVAAIGSSSQVTLSANATASGTVVLAFGVEPVTVADARKHVFISYTSDDDIFARLITAARRYCETALRSALLTQTWLMSLDGFPGYPGYWSREVRRTWPAMAAAPNLVGTIDLPMPPLQSIVSVQYYGFDGTLQTVSPNAYNVSLGQHPRIEPIYTSVWPIAMPRQDAVQITFTAGYGNTAAAIDESVKQAILMCVGHWWNHRSWVSEAGNNFMSVPNTVDALLSVADPGIYG
jgi:uncharacterized phiE125 gp8 family phage protein